MPSPPAVSANRLARMVGQPTGRTLYRWLFVAIARLVTDGQLPVGARLPSERALAEATGLSRVTVGKAYSDLVDAELLVTRQGAGSFVSLPHGHARPLLGGLEPGRDRPDVIDLTCAVVPGHPRVQGAARRAAAKLGSYLSDPGYHPLGLLPLRDEIAQSYDRRGLRTDPDQIVVTAGAVAAVSLVARALLRPGERALCESPGYPNTILALAGAGARLHPLPVGADGVEPGAVGSAMRSVRPRLTLLAPDYQNPTGHLMSDAERAETARFARDLDLTVVVDETLAGIVLDAPAEPPRPFAAHLADAVSIGSASKLYWGGLRVGWVRAPHHLVPALAAARMGIDLGAPVLEQLLLAELMADGQTVDLQTLRAQRDALVREVRERLPQWRFRIPHGGLALWCELPVGDQRTEGAAELALRAESHAVLLAPGGRFAVESGLDRFLRLPFTLDEATLADAVERIAAAWSLRRPGRGAGTASPAPVL